MICNNCGNNIEDKSQFCPYCGETVTAEPQQPTYAAPQQPTYTAPQQPAYTAPQQPTYAAPQQPTYTAPQQSYGMPQQPYGMPQPTTAGPAVPGKGLGIGSMVLGIVSLALFCIWYLAIPCAIVGAALGGVAYSKAKQAGMKNGMAAAGIACSCVALGIAVIMLIIGGAAACAITDSFYDTYEVLDEIEYYY